MSIINRVRNAYNQDGAKEVFRRASRLGLIKCIDMIDTCPDEDKILRSKEILDEINKQVDYEKLPTIQDPAPLQRSESRNPFDDMKSEGEFLQLNQYSYRPDFIYEMEDIRLLGPNGIGITKNGVILEDSITMPGRERVDISIQRSYNQHPLLTIETVYTSRRSSRRTSQTLNCACPLFSAWNGYYHWITEHLPKLRGIKHHTAKNKSRPTFIIPSDPPHYIRETLKLLDIKQSDWFEWESPAVDVRNLILPSYPEANPENLHWLRASLRDSVQEKEQWMVPSHVYVSREKMSTRRIENERQVLNLLSEFNFERVFAEELSFKNQVRLFSKADKIISPHGAGLTNMIWGDKMTIFEIFNDHVRDHYYVLANNLGHDYIPIQGNSTQPMTPDSNFTVDIERLEVALSDNINQ